jgi:dihydroorotate dehydrogenase
MASHEDYSGQAFVDDFVRVALLAAEAGAPAIELNVSCSNRLALDGQMMDPLCEDPRATREVVHAVRVALDEQGHHDVPLVAKLGYLDYELLTTLLPMIVDDVKGIAGINTLQLPILDPETGQPAFSGIDANGVVRIREQAGVSGVALRYLALDFVQSLNRLRKAHNWDFDILAMGGVMDAHDVRALRAAGADSVQTATAASTNPSLPLQMRDWGLIRKENLEEIREAVLADDGSLRTVADVATRLGLPAERLEPLFPGKYDLPRFVAEIVAIAGGLPPDGDGVDREHSTPAELAVAINTALKRVRRRRLRDQLLTVAEAAQRLHATEDEVRRRVLEGEMVAFGLGQVMRIPTWQYAIDKPDEVIDGVAEMARAFPGGFAALSAFAVTPHPDLEGLTPVEALQSGQKEQVLTLSGAIAAAGR